MMMVSNAESSEQTWNYRQKQLADSRNGARKQTKTNKNKNSYEAIHANRRLNQNASKQQNDVGSFRPFRPNANASSDQDLNRSLSKQQTVIIKRKPNNKNTNDNVNNFQPFTPLGTPTTYRNNASAVDPYGINPLPSIRSPFVSSRDPVVPNLESWGVGSTALNPDSYYLNRLSPYLPTYTALTKNQKPYIVVPTLNRPAYRVPSPVIDPYSRYNYISVIPYTRPEFDYVNLEPSGSRFNQEFENQRLKSDEYIKSAQLTLKKFETKTYDGSDLFSTKFLEDLDYTPASFSSKPVKRRVRLPDQDPIAEEIIQSAKAEAYRQVPDVNYINREPINEPRYNKHAIDIAENIYQNEINSLVRQMAERAYNEERNYKQSFERPIYDSIYESTIREMVIEVAKEVLVDHQKQIQFLQSHEIKKVAKEKIVNTLMLDHMLDTVAQHGKVVAENDDVAQLLDSMLLEVLLVTHSDVRKVKEKTLKNYPLKKFHLNSYMNVALDILVAELSSGLEEDMKDLDDIEKRS